jgi:hypothetical protein
MGMPYTLSPKAKIKSYLGCVTRGARGESCVCVILPLPFAGDEAGRAMGAHTRARPRPACQYFLLDYKP